MKSKNYRRLFRCVQIRGQKQIVRPFPSVHIEASSSGSQSPSVFGWISKAFESASRELAE
jgi:hypothetical protein